MKQLLIVCVILCKITIASAQSLSPIVLPMGAGCFTGGGNSLSWTLGEPLTHTYYNTNNILSQGFQQPEVDSVNPGAIITGTIATTLCSGNTLNVPFQAISNYFPGNIFSAQLSDSFGSFNSPVVIGSLLNQFSGSILCTLPTGISGSGYRIRVISTYPAITGTNNGVDISIVGFLLPAVNVVASTASSICAGTSVVFTATPVNGGVNPFYQWKKNNVNVGANSPVYTDANLNNLDTVICIMTSGLSCLLNNPVYSSPVILTVIPLVNPAITISSNQPAAICPEIEVTFSALIMNGGSMPFYQWKKNGINVGANSATYSASGFANNDIITCTLTSTVSCVTNNTAISNNIVMQLGSCTISNPSAFSNIICTGSSFPLSFGTNPSVFNPGNIFTVQLDSTAGFSSPLVIGSLVSAIPTDIPCVIPYTVLSGNNYKFRVISSNPPMIGNASNQIMIKSFERGFTESIGTNTGTISIAAHETSNGFDNDSLTMSGAGDIRNNQNSVGYQQASGGSNVFITTTPGTDFQIAGINTLDGYNFQLNFGIFKSSNGSSGSELVVEVSSNGSSYNQLSFPALPTGSGTAIWYYRTASGIIPATSNLRIRFRQTSSTSQFRIDDVKLTFNDSLAGITANGNTTFCNPGNVVLTAKSGSAYNWNSGGSTQSITANTTNFYLCMITSNNGCVLRSNTINVNANPVIPASVNIIANVSGSICSGTPVVFTATPVNGGTSPVYQWKKNGTNAGTNNPVYIDSGLVNNDQVTCQLISNSTCISGSSTVLSNAITISVNSNVTPAVNILSNPQGTVCSGTNVIFAASPVNGGTTPLYQWQRNGINVGSNSVTYSNSALANGDQVQCNMTSNAVCLIGNATVASNGLLMSVNTNLVPVLSINVNPVGTVCPGTTLNFTANAINGGISPYFQWKKNGLPVGTNTSSYSDNSFANGDQVTCTMQPSECVTTGIVISNTIPVSFWNSAGIFSFGPSSGAAGATVGIIGFGFTDSAVVRFNGTVASYIFVSQFELIATVPVGATSGFITVNYQCGFDQTLSPFTVISSEVTLNVKVFIEGFYMSSGNMQPLLNTIELSQDVTACDSLTIELHSALSPYDKVYGGTALLHTNGNAQIKFPDSVLEYSSYFYIVIRHRNTLETWSKYPVLFNSSSTVNFDFTSP
jgi:hypothetical protein